jgi:predicted RNase H-like HicB family nuclease
VQGRRDRNTVQSREKETGFLVELYSRSEYYGEETRFLKRYAPYLKTVLGSVTMKTVKIIVERHPEGYVAYPLGIVGAVVGEGDTYEQALNDVRSAIAFHIETFGESVLESESVVLEAFVDEARV